MVERITSNKTTNAFVSENNIDLLKLTADNKHITFNNNISADLLVYADIEMMNTIFRNLISNAIKYTNEYGQIILGAKEEKDN